MNKSVPKGSHLEFINLTPLNPLISKCEIKVLYTGKNRNRSFISKEVATKMANSLPGTPIVGQYLLSVNDFGDHGEEELVIDEHGVRFVKDTVPYGFVAPDAKVWWQMFLDKDGVEREYLLTEGYLWTGRYPETRRIIEQGNNQSMELDRNTLVGEWSKIEGEWSKVDNDEHEYFIINDATFTALCILGQDVEPCFEGASIGAKNSRMVYSLDRDDFKEKMLDFMADLKDALNYSSYKGGKEMENLNNPVIETPEVEVPVVETPVVETPVVEEHALETPVVEEPAVEDEFVEKKKKDEEDAEDDKDPEDKDEPADDEDDSDDDKDDEDEEEKKKKKNTYSLEEVVEYQELLERFNLLQGQFDAISNELNSIKPEYSKLKELQVEAEEKAKDDMINSFYMLSDEDKKEVIENKVNFSLEDIEAKLSVICVRKKVNFGLNESSENDSNTETPITTFNVEDSYDSTPAWLKVVDNIAKNRK